MKQISLTLIAVFIGMLPASAKEQTKYFEFGDITSIYARNPFRVHITQGSSDKVTVVYDDEIEKCFKLDVSYSDTGCIGLQLEQLTKKIIFDDPSCLDRIDVYFEMDDIRSIKLIGSVTADFAGNFTSDDLTIDTGNRSVVKNLKVNGESLLIDAGVSSTINLEGDFQKTVKIEATGSSKIRMTGNTTEIDAYLGTVSTLKYVGNAVSCKIRCTGSASAELKGNAENCEYGCGSGAEIDAKKFICKNATVEMTGTSTAIVNVSELMKYHVGRAAKLIYYGDAKLHNLNEDDNVINGR